MRSVRVISWNLNHRCREKLIPDGISGLFVELDADLILLNEFVDGPSRRTFRDSMRGAGYGHQAVSFTPALHNQVFAASRFPFTVGDVAPPTLGDRQDGSAIANFLHIRFEHLPLEVVGMRAPAYDISADVKAYWAELAAIMLGVSDRPIVFAGDINQNPFKRARMPDVPSLSFPLCPAYCVPNPVGEWSYKSPDGRGLPTRIDHVLHTSRVTVMDTRYIAVHDDLTLAGLRAEHPISDHALLAFTANC